MHRLFALAALLLFVVSFGEGRAQTVSFPTSGWTLSIDGGARYSAQHDQYTSVLTYGGFGSFFAAHIGRDGRWQHGADVVYYRARRTPIGDEVSSVVDRTHHIEGGGITVTVRRRIVRRSAWRFHAGLHVRALGTTWVPRHAIGGVEDGYDVFATAAVDARLERALSLRDRLIVRLSFPLGALAYRPLYIGGGSERSLATWPHLQGFTTRFFYARSLSSHLAGRLGYRVRLFRYEGPPDVTRLAHLFTLGLAVHL